MAEWYMGEIRMFAGPFAPRGWFFCQGQLLPISQWTALFSLLGTTYGGDGRVTFGLPDLRGRLPVHASNGYTLGQASGAESITLIPSQLPAHSHALQASTDPATATSPEGATWATAQTDIYVAGGTQVNLSGSAISAAGGNQPHNNLQPFLSVNFIIAVEGIFPSRP